MQTLDAYVKHMLVNIITMFAPMVKYQPTGTPLNTHTLKLHVSRVLEENWPGYQATLKTIVLVMSQIIFPSKHSLTSAFTVKTI